MQVEWVADDRLVVRHREKSANRWLIGGTGLIAIMAVVVALAAKDLPLSPIAMTIFVGAIVATLFIRPAATTTATFDRRKDSLIVVRKRRGTVLEERRMTLSQVEAIGVGPIAKRGGNSKFALAMTVGEEVVNLMPSAAGPAEEAERIAGEIRRFLGLPQTAATDVEKQVTS